MTSMKPHHILYETNKKEAAYRH